MATTIDKTKLAAMLAKIRAERSQAAVNITPTEKTEILGSPNNPISPDLIEDKNGKLISYNTKQQEFES